MDLSNWLRAEWDRVAGFALIILGAVFLVLGYIGVSDSPYMVENLSYITSGGIGGLFMLGAGATLLVSADLHDEWRKLDRVEDAIRSGVTVPAPLTSVPGSNGDAPAPAERVTA
ncbi:MAG: hypothetical protein ACRDH5_05890 [bacterium]